MNHRARIPVVKDNWQCLWGKEKKGGSQRGKFVRRRAQRERRKRAIKGFFFSQSEWGFFETPAEGKGDPKE